MRLKLLSFSNLTLLVALSLSSVAAWYSIIGLTAIFAGAVIPVIIMGSILEIGKITTTVWLRKYWHRASLLLKIYLVPAVIALALLTSMGIFGFLSKAHMEQGIASGDVTAKVSLIDEKIKTQRDNIEVARKALSQMDSQVDARLSRGDSENSAERAVQIRRQQSGERSKLQKEIGEAQKVIATLNEERAPIASELRKVEAEVGPIKYIAALIYGDNADQNMLEGAVRWVIILLVIVFDPLAIALVLAANASKDWDDEKPEPDPTYEPDDGSLTKDQIDQITELASENLPNGEVITKSELFPDRTEEANNLLAEVEKEVDEVMLPEEPIVVKEKPILEQHPYLNTPFVSFNSRPMVHKPKFESSFKIKNEYDQHQAEIPLVELSNIRFFPTIPATVTEIVTEGVTKQFVNKKPYKEFEGGYVTFEGKHMHKNALKEAHPEFFRISADTGTQSNTGFGINFPKEAKKGDVFVRVDALPNRVFKFDGSKWIEVRKEQSDTYLHNEMYIQHLISKIDSGEYDIELLTDTEKEQIAEYLSQNPKS